MQRGTLAATTLATALAAGLTACTDANSPARVALAFSTRSAPASLGGAMSASGVQNDTAVIGNDSIIVTRVQIVFREIELERVDVADCPDDDDAGNGDGCEELSAGITLVDLPLDGGADKVITVDVAPGMYDEIEFAIHAPDPTADAAFIATNPTFAGVSIRVTGIYSQAGTRTNFEFTTDLSEQQEVELSPPVDITAAGPLNITVRLDLATWFVNAAGTALVDPASATTGGPNANLVADNIRNSIEAFQDDDSDGLDDDDEDDDGGNGTGAR